MSMLKLIKKLLKCYTINNMEDIFEEVHNEFINSEEYLNYIKETEAWGEKK